MTVTEIKAAVDAGKKVNWSNGLYEVRKAGNDYNIVCTSNNHCIGLTWTDGTTLNGKEEEFFIVEDILIKKEITPLEAAKQKLIEKAKADIAKYGYAEVSTCCTNAYGWSKDEHYAMQELQRESKEFRITSKVKFEVSDWTIIPKVN